MAFDSFSWLATEAPDLTDQLRNRAYRVTDVDYDSFAKPRKQSPLRALRQARVAVDLASGHGRLHIEFDLERDDTRSVENTLVDVRLTAEGDPVIEALASTVDSRTTSRILANADR
jgi:hypothetical protein